MNKLILVSIIALAGLTASAQNKTNASITIKVTVEDKLLGTNSATLKLDGAGAKRDLMMVNGAYWWQSEMVRGQQASVTNTLDTMIKDRIKGFMEADGLAFNASQQAILLNKLSVILNTQPELLSDAQKNQLANIAALLP